MLVTGIIDKFGISVDIRTRDRQQIVFRRLKLAFKRDFFELREVVDIVRLDIQTLCFFAESLFCQQPATHIPEVLILKIKLNLTFLTYNLAEFGLIKYGDSMATIIAVINIILTTALSTIGALRRKFEFQTGKRARCTPWGPKT